MIVDRHSGGHWEKKKRLILVRHHHFHRSSVVIKVLTSCKMPENRRCIPGTFCAYCVCILPCKKDNLTLWGGLPKNYKCCKTLFVEWYQRCCTFVSIMDEWKSVCPWHKEREEKKIVSVLIEKYHLTSHIVKCSKKKYILWFWIFSVVTNCLYTMTL